MGLTEQNLRTARTRLNIKPVRVGGEFGGKGAKWIWKLPDSQDVDGAERSVQDVKEADSQHLIVNHSDKHIYCNDLAQDVDGKVNNIL
jgi:hypothetical protein